MHKIIQDHPRTCNISKEEHPYSQTLRLKAICPETTEFW